MGSVVWMLGWMAVYLPWSWTLEYFLLPFTLGAAVFAGVALGQIVQDLQRATGGWTRYLAAVGLGVFAIVWPMTFSRGSLTPSR